MLQIAPAAQLNTFFSISRLLAGQLDFLSAIRSVAAEVSKVLPHDHMDVCIVRLDGKFHTAYEAGIETAWSKLLAPIANSPIRSLLMGEVDHILTDDAVTDARFAFKGAFCAPIFDHSLRSRIHVPMMVHGEIIGAFSCSLLTPNGYASTDLECARFIADMLSPYFFALRASEQAQQSAIIETEARAREEGLRLGALKLTEALEGERQRIGMDLHDQTLADLTRLTRRLERLSLSETAARAALEPITRGLHHCMEDLRQIIEEAKPSVLHLFGFSQAVENHLDRSIRDSGFAMEGTLEDLSGGAFDSLEPRVSIALFRIAQEAINNAVNHSQATQLVICLRVGLEMIELTITDNGKGIPKRRTRLGRGIDNMKTRAKLISARFGIHARPEGSGTQIVISMPKAAIVPPQTDPSQDGPKESCE
jgi:signal transduction histidine kinase